MRKKDKSHKSAYMGKDYIISIIAALLIPTPILIACTVSSFESVQWQGLLSFLICGAVAWVLGQFLGFLLKNAEGKVIYAVRAGFIIGAIGLVVGYEILFFAVNKGSAALFFMPAALILWYWLGYKTGAGVNPVSYVMLGVYCGETVIMYLLCGAFEGEAHAGRDIMLLITALMTILGALIINGRQLDKASFRGKKDSDILSVFSKRFNVKSTIIFSAVILFLFFFARYGAQLLWLLAQAVLRFLIYFISLFNVENPEDGTGETGGLFIPPTEGEQSDNLIGEIVTVVVLAVLIILLIKPFVKGMKALYRKIVKRLGRSVQEQEETPQYTDIYEISEGSEFEGKDKDSFKKAVKAFKREKDYTKKYRAGYRAFMIYIGEKKELSPSETARVHLEKGRALTDSPYLEKAVEIYCKVRYDDYIADNEDIVVIGNLLKTL